MCSTITCSRFLLLLYVVACPTSPLFLAACFLYCADRSLVFLSVVTHRNSTKHVDLVTRFSTLRAYDANKHRGTSELLASLALHLILCVVCLFMLTHIDITSKGAWASWLWSI